MARGDFTPAQIESMGPVAIKYWDPQVGPAGEADQPLTTTQLELLDDVLRERNALPGCDSRPFWATSATTPPATRRACCPGSAPTRPAPCCSRSRRVSGRWRSSPAPRRPAGCPTEPRGWRCLPSSHPAPTGTSRRAGHRRPDPGRSGRNTARTVNLVAGRRRRSAPHRQRPGAPSGCPATWRSARRRPGAQGPLGARAAFRHEPAQGGGCSWIPLDRKIHCPAGVRPARVQPDHDLLRHLDRAPLPHPGNVGEVPSTNGASNSVCDGWENPAIAALCNALAIPSSPITRSQTAALCRRRGSAPATVSHCAHRTRWDPLPPRCRSRRGPLRHAPPARPATSRTGRCRPSTRPRAPTRPASRR